MADLDSKQKRESGFGITLPFARVGPTPDGSDADSEDARAHLVMNYGGITTGIGGAPAISILVRALSNVVITGGSAMK
jgi:hypothetical protein